MKRKVLVVDDEPMLAQLIAELIKTDQIDAEWCVDPNEAFALGQKTAFDFIISDIAMPVMSGIEMIQAWESRCGKVPPVIFVTGHTHIKKPQISGVEVLALLSKPAHDRDLILLIEGYAKK